MLQRSMVALMTSCILLAGCRERPTGGQRNGGSARIVRLDELTEAEKRYGQSAKPSTAVTYQPDVVMPPAGAEAIRGVSPDGLVWTIDPSSKAAEAIQPGKVLVLTSRAAGRVLGVQKTAGGLQVVLGPVEITEVVREGRFSLKQPLDLDHALSFNVPEVFDPVVPVPPIVTSLADQSFPSFAALPSCDSRSHSGGTIRLAAYQPGCTPGGVAFHQIGLNQGMVHRFTMTPIVGAKGIGVRIASDQSGVHFLGEAVLYLQTPSLYFDLDIKEGKIVLCEVQLEGVGGLLMTFEAASPTPRSANISETRFAPVDFSIPVAGMGVPFAVNVRQKFRLQSAFTSTGTIKARAYYTLKGGLRAGYRDGKWSMGGPTGVKPVESLDHLLFSTQGMALGVTGMVMTHHASVMVGIGAFGFLTGPYGYLNSSVTVTRGSDAGILRGPTACKQATLSMGVGAGVGYMIPEPVTGAINSMLRALNVREEIKSSGGLETKPVIIVDIGRYHPSLQACAG
jgi:hypothetical protein